MFTSKKPIPLTKFESLLLIPAAINIEELIKAAILYSVEIESNRLLALISLIATKLTSYNYINKRYETHKKTNIHSDELKKCCGNKYTIYLDFLFASNILSTRSPFNNKIAGQSFGYGFKGIYRFSRLKTIKINNTKTVHHEKKFDSYVKKFEKILYRPFDRTKFSMDFNIAEEKLFDKYLRNITFPFAPDETHKWERYSAYHGALKQLVKFFNGEHKFTRKTKQFTRKPSGRFYSPLTFLNKVTRSLLYYEGQKLYQLDVKNMFPYLLSQYLTKLAILNPQRVKRLQKCPIIESKYKLSTIHKAKVFPSENWLKQHLKERFGALFSSELISRFPKISLVKVRADRYFFLEKTKSLFQNNVQTLNQSNKKYYFPLGYNSKKENYNKTAQDNWNSFKKRDQRTNIYTNRYNLPKGLDYNSHLATLYAETHKSLNTTKHSNFASKDYSNYISTKTLETLMNKEIQKFNTLSTEGIIYNYFIEPFMSRVSLIEWAIDYQKLFNEDYNHLPEQNRALTKRLFIAMLYAKNNQYTKEQEIFKSEFPILYDLIREKKKGDHTIITHDLFDLEAEIIVDTVARGLLKNSIPTFTIHDCIAVQEGNIEVAKLALKNAFISKFRSYPKIELE